MRNQETIVNFNESNLQNKILGLKKVTSDMQTHKNTALRSGPAPFKAPVSLPSPGNKAPAPVANKPPVFTRDGKKWLIVSIPSNYPHSRHHTKTDDLHFRNIRKIIRIC